MKPLAIFIIFFLYFPFENIKLSNSFVSFDSKTSEVIINKFPLYLQDDLIPINDLKHFQSDTN